MIQKQLMLFILISTTLTQSEPITQRVAADTIIQSSTRIYPEDDLPEVDDVKEYSRELIEKEEQARIAKERAERIKQEQARIAKEREEKIKQEQIYLLAQIIHAEAKGEPYNGKVAVGNVVMNRVKHEDFPNTLREVIFQDGQFSPVSDGSIYNTPGEDSLRAAKEVLNGVRMIGSEVLYFYNPDTSTSGWIYTRQTATEIGNHRFAI